MYNDFGLNIAIYYIKSFRFGGISTNHNSWNQHLLWYSKNWQRHQSASIWRWPERGRFIVSWTNRKIYLTIFFIPVYCKELKSHNYFLRGSLFIGPNWFWTLDRPNCFGRVKIILVRFKLDFLDYIIFIILTWPKRLVLNQKYLDP